MFDHSAPINKTVIAVVGILAATCLIAFYIWTSQNRYYIMTGSQGVGYEVDRKTGESWMLRGAHKIRQQADDEGHEKEAVLPYADAGKITGNAGLRSGLFSGELYNGSDWVVTRMIVNVSATVKDGSTRWSRDFSTAVRIEPLTTGRFVISVAEDEGITNTQWALKKVFGHKE